MSRVEKPTSHGVHWVAPWKGTAEPAEHELHAVSPLLAANDPCAHREHVVRPSVCPYSPAGHSAQTPGSGEYCPAGHDRHVDDDVPEEKYPTLQEHALGCVDPGGAFEFAGHWVHSLVPIPDAYVFRGHSLHDVPALAAWNVPAAHDMHPPDPARPSEVENVPAGQPSHSPPESEYVPAEQLKHDEADGSEDRPGGHRSHWVWLTSTLKVPFEQGVQAVAPVVAENLPAAQPVHSATSSQ